VRVLIPQALRSYTDQRDCVDAEGATLDELLVDLDDRYPGIRFRMINEQDEMRPHIAFFVGGEKTRDLNASLAGTDEVVIMQALSGG
jgi:molybdopterin converting factor small subunit